MDYIFNFNSSLDPEKVPTSLVLVSNGPTAPRLLRRVSSRREKQHLAPGNTSIPARACGATGISSWRQQEEQGQDEMPYWVLVHIYKCACVCERVCIAIKMQNLHGCSNLPVPLDRPAGLAWQQVQHVHRDATASLGYI